MPRLIEETWYAKRSSNSINEQEQEEEYEYTEMKFAIMKDCIFIKVDILLFILILIRMSQNPFSKFVADPSSIPDPNKITLKQF